MDNKKLAFISYRREDSSAASRNVRDHLEIAYGAECVFMDVEGIRAGTDWQEAIRSAIARADILIVVLGAQWLRIQDEYGRRRIDKQGDWVHDEIALSLLRGIPIIPVLIMGASMFPPEALPLDICRFVAKESLELRENRWKGGISSLLKRLDELGFQRAGQRHEFPVLRRNALVPRALTDEELASELKKIPGWQLSPSSLPDQHLRQRVEIMKAFRFKRFEDAIAFMAAAVPDIDRLNHHPRWENVWKTVTIWLSTWDAGHVITYLDIDLAKLLDNLYETSVAKALW
jgi:pterin-4a-carbinolamine dehydratase